MRVLVTGGAGYVGSVLVPALIERGYAVRVVDCGMFGVQHVHPEAELIVADVLDFQESWLDRVDAVINLAGLSNDPMAAFSPSLNYILNAAGASIVAHAAKEAGIRRFVFGSTCSVYGLSDDNEVDEQYEASPSFPYATSKLMAELCVRCLTDERFRPIILRKGTVVGWSPRMRFDLVVNAMVKTALTQRRIVVHNPHLWRPLIDVRDAAAAYISALEADVSVTGIFNIAAENYNMGRLAEEVATTLRALGTNVPLVLENRHDVRSYRVSTAKAKSTLGFEASTGIAETVREIMDHIRRHEVTDFSDPRYYNVEQLKLTMAGAQPSANGTYIRAAA